MQDMLLLSVMLKMCWGKATWKGTQKQDIRGSVLDPLPLVLYICAKALPNWVQPSVCDAQTASGRDRP